MKFFNKKEKQIASFFLRVGMLFFTQSLIIRTIKGKIPNSRTNLIHKFNKLTFERMFLRNDILRQIFESLIVC